MHRELIHVLTDPRVWSCTRRGLGGGVCVGAGDPTCGWHPHPGKDDGSGPDTSTPACLCRQLLVLCIHAIRRGDLLRVVLASTTVVVVVAFACGSSCDGALCLVFCLQGGG